VRTPQLYFLTFGTWSVDKATNMRPMPSPETYGNPGAAIRDGVGRIRAKRQETEMKMRSGSILVGAGIALCAVSAHGKTIVGVGGCTAHTNYATIGAAIADLTGVPAGSTIQICPGNYPEQLEITRPLTLVGLSNGNSSAPTITSPNPIQQNTARLSGAAVAAQVFVHNTANVTISNLVIDGNNNGLSNGCATDIIGIFYQNASGSILNNAVVNQGIAGGVGCQDGQAIWAESGGNGNASTMLIQNNFVSNFDKNGITLNEWPEGGGATFGTISGNTVSGLGVTPLTAGNGLQVGRGATAKIMNNTIGGFIYVNTSSDPNAVAGAAAILIFDSVGFQVSGNHISESQNPIALVNFGLPTGSAKITGNVISGAPSLTADYTAGSTTFGFDAIDLCGSSNNTVTGNTITGSAESAIHVDGECNSTPSLSNTVQNNKINLACAGILISANSSMTPGANTILNAHSQVLPGTDSCTTTPHRGGARAVVRASPARP
jgi:parallel beta-helix repeat protein